MEGATDLGVDRVLGELSGNSSSGCEEEGGVVLVFVWVDIYTQGRILFMYLYFSFNR